MSDNNSKDAIMQENIFISIALCVIAGLCWAAWKVGSFNFKQLMYDLFDEDGKFCRATNKWAIRFLIAMGVVIIIRVVYGLVITFIN